MRYLLDTCTLIYYISQHDKLNSDVQAILQEWDSRLCVSAETIRELVVGYNNNKWYNKRWATCEEMARSIERDYGVDILPVDKYVTYQYSILRLNTAQSHKDPSDHIIISHAIVTHIPLISSDKKFDFYRGQGLELIENF